MTRSVRHGWAAWLPETTAPLLQACKPCKLHCASSAARCPHVSPLAVGMGPSDGEGGGSEWLQRAFSVLELEDVELDLEQLDTLGKVGSGVQGEEERHAVARIVCFCC